MAPPSKPEILQKIQAMMQELFELDAGRVRPEARLVDDLKLDSLDALDLAVKVEEVTGLAFDEAKIRELRTVEDVMLEIEASMLKGSSPARAAASSDS